MPSQFEIGVTREKSLIYLKYLISFPFVFLKQGAKL